MSNLSYVRFFQYPQRWHEGRHIFSLTGEGDEFTEETKRQKQYDRACNKLLSLPIALQKKHLILLLNFAYDQRVRRIEAETTLNCCAKKEMAIHKLRAERHLLKQGMTTQLEAGETLNAIFDGIIHSVSLDTALLKADVAYYLRYNLCFFVKATHHRVHSGHSDLAFWVLQPAQYVSAHRVILLMHGWHDSSEGMRHAAEIYQREGFHVYALDWPGHGVHYSKDTISPEVLRQYYRDMLDYIRRMHQSSEFTVVAHSMGAAIALTETDYANSLGVTKYQLFCPAITQTLGEVGLNLLSAFRRRNLAPSVLRTQKQSPLFGGHGPGLLPLLQLMKKAYQCAQDWMTHSSAWQFLIIEIYQGMRDLSVPYHAAERLGKLACAPHRVFLSPEGDHGPHMTAKQGRQFIKSTLVFSPSLSAFPRPAGDDSALPLGPVSQIKQPRT